MKKNKYIKRIFLVFLLVLLVINAIPMTAFAKEEATTNYKILIDESNGYGKWVTSSKTPIKKTDNEYESKFEYIEIDGLEVESVNKSETALKYIITLKENQTIPDTINVHFGAGSTLTKKIYNTSTGELTDTVGPRAAQYPVISDDENKLKPMNIAMGTASSEDNLRALGIPFSSETGVGQKTFYYLLTQDDVKTSNLRECTLIFKTPNAVLDEEIIAVEDVQITDGTSQWINETSLYTRDAYGKLLTDYGVNEAKISVKATSGYDLYLNDEKQSANTEGKYELTLGSSTDGVKHTVEIREGETAKAAYEIFCLQKKFDDLPDKVVDYMCVASQYTNGGAPAGVDYGTMERANSTLTGKIWSFDESRTVYLASAGNFGGYITYYYDTPITDNSKNPYGIDFVVIGNPVTADSGFCEPGNVLVSENGNEWYSLAGSLHYDETAVWNYEMTYTRNESGNASWQGSDGQSGTLNYAFPRDSYYPLYTWSDESKQTITLSGTRIKPAAGKNEYGNTTPTFPAFGYADCGKVTDSNMAYNPYMGFAVKEIGEGNLLERSDGFDLAWAVDEQGKPVDVSDKEFHYVKVQTASFISNSSIGEKSTEVNMMRIAAPNESDVGKTSEPDSILFDGKKVTIEKGKYLYDVNVEGIFDVAVKGADNANVYINSIRSKTATFNKLAHGMVRIIIQEGIKEPQIYYFNVNDTGDDSDDVFTAIYLDADKGGRIYDSQTEILYFDKNSSNTALPVPTKEGYQFQGWYGGQVLYNEYTTDMPETVKLTAKWKSNSPATPEEPDKKINVTFRLIGATKAAASGVDLTGETKEGYCGSEYVTWIPTKAYTLPADSTVYDLIKAALRDAGIREVGAENGYIETIYAPASLGGYALSEFTNGKYSGWMYTLNGKHTDGIKIQKLSDGAAVVLHYVNDYRYEVSDWQELGGPNYPQLGTGKFHDEWLKAPDSIGGTGGGMPVDKTADTVTTTGASGSATTTAPTEVKVSGSTATATVKAENQSEILKQAAENKSAEIVLEVSKADSKGADSVQLSLDVTFVKNVADKTNADLTVNTENGKVTLDQETLKTIIGEAKGNTVTIEITKVTKPTEAQKKAAGVNGHLLKLTIKSGDKVISDFNKGKVKVVAEIVSKLLDKKVAAIHIAEDGKIEQLAGKILTIGGKKYYEFTTPHFSTFALVDADELGLEVNDEEANIVKIKELVPDMSLKARSSKTSKKNIKVTLTVDKSTAAAIKEIKEMGYTVKYKYYRSTKKASKYQAKVTKTTKSFTNTAGKKGTKYYYKARIQVYDKDGNLVAQTTLKQCRYAARTWTK